MAWLGTAQFQRPAAQFATTTHRAVQPLGLLEPCGGLRFHLSKRLDTKNWSPLWYCATWACPFALCSARVLTIVIRVSGTVARASWWSFGSAVELQTQGVYMSEVFRIQCARFLEDTSPTPDDLFSGHELQWRRRNLHKMCGGRIAASRHVSAHCLFATRYAPSFSARCHCSSDHTAPSRKTVRILREELSSAAPAAKNGRADFDSLSRLTHCKGLQTRQRLVRVKCRPKRLPIIIFTVLRLRGLSC